MKKQTDVPVFFTTRDVCPCCGHEKYTFADVERWQLEFPEQLTDDVLRGDKTAEPAWARALCWGIAGSCSFDPSYRSPTVTELVAEILAAGALSWDGTVPDVA